MGVLVWAAAAAAFVPRFAEEHLADVLDAPTAAMVERLQAADSAQRAEIVEGWRSDHVSLTPPPALGDTAMVRSGGLVIALGYPEVYIYREIDPQTWLALGPLPLMPGGAELRWVALALLATLGIGTGAWVALRPVRRTLDRLTVVAQAFGAGDLAARARVQGPDELMAVGEAFDAMADRIHALLRVQQETLQGVSHELRTPLTRARFALELVADTDAPDERAALAERAAEDLDQMERLLEELLAYLRLDALHDLSLQPTELRALVASLAEQRVPVQIHGDGSAEVEPRLLRRALRNLMANAARHASARVVVEIEVSCGVVRLSVDDDGPGIPPGEREQILQPFRRGRSARTLDPTGSGLGLPIAARVVRAHGGSLQIDTSPLGGARVSLVFPVSPPGQGR